MLAAFDKISQIKENVKIFCGHEYTLQNYAFAKRFDDCNEALDKQIENAKHNVESGLHSIPSTVGIEKLSNVFMQCRET